MMEKFNFLVDSTFNLLQASEKNETKLSETIQKINSNIESLETNTNNFDRQISQSLEKHSKITAQSISKNVLTNLNEANETAKQAARIYQNAARFSIVKLSAIFSIFFLFVGAMLWFFFIKEIPTIDEIYKLRQEKKLLEYDISKLKSFGDIASCGKHAIPCIKVDLSARYGKDKVPYYIIRPKK